MAESNLDPTILEEGLGALAIMANIVVSSLSRPWYSKWGATESEVESSWFGDEQVPEPNLENTRAITIQAPAEAVWPWLVQMGQGRGGLYSYVRLENMAGCEMENAGRINPEHQDLEVGDQVRLAPEGRGPAFVVRAIEPGRAIILGGDEPPTSWGFILEPIDEYSTRLITRYRQKYERTFGNTLMWRVITDPIHFVMERKMLQGIKRRVEGTSAN